MASDNSEILALLADLLRATDRQTDANTRAVNELRQELRQATSEIREEMRQTTQETNARFEAIFDRFATAVADGFVRGEKKLDEVKQEVGGLRGEVRSIDQRLARVEENQPTAADLIRRLEVLESIVLNKAS